MTKTGKEDWINRLKKRDDKIIKRFKELRDRQYDGKQMLKSAVIISMLRDEFPPLSEKYIENIVYGRVEYKSKKERCEP